MKHLTIENVGPIAHVDFEIQRFNFFIGPQSSGKSTVAKILSTCLWMEKEIATLMDDTLFNEPRQFKSQFENYHRMMGFFTAKSYIKYESDVALIVYQNETPSITLKSRDSYQRYKICYTPAERNMITSPELSGFDFGQTSLRSFLFDWYKARELFTEKNKLSILDLDVKYFYDPSETRYQDRIEHSNGMRYNIPLYASSSGLQSVVPLTVMLSYYSNEYFETFKDITSFDERDREREIRRRVVDEVVLKAMYPDFDPAKREELIKGVNERIHDHDPEVMPYFERYLQLSKQLLVPTRTSFILEEPEQNLYPSTQKQLVYALAETLNRGNHTCVISTHSPYIMTSVNNLILAADKMAESEQKAQKVQERIPAIQAIPFDDVAAFEMRDGQMVSIKDDEFRMISADALDKASEEIGDDYNFLLDL